nr:PREDICTED: A disintegrin and metalloproteinase with thrombospondin motifs 8 [Struthio camelus australis]
MCVWAERLQSKLHLKMSSKTLRVYSTRHLKQRAGIKSGRSILRQLAAEPDSRDSPLSRRLGSRLPFPLGRGNEERVIPDCKAWRSEEMTEDRSKLGSRGGEKPHSNGLGLSADFTFRVGPVEKNNHVLTLMSMAARIYKHPSLKNAVNLVVVKVLIVEDEAAGPEVSDNGGLTLRNFCNWQQKFNPPSDRHPEHYDTAILLTRQDFCGHQSCDTLGVADIGTMCDRNKSCSGIEDEGLQAAWGPERLARKVGGSPGGGPAGKSFREQQCEKYNNYNFTDLDGNRLEWVPKYAGVSPRDRCKLFCRARGRSEFKVFEAKVRHGATITASARPYRAETGPARSPHCRCSSSSALFLGVCGGKGNNCGAVGRQLCLFAPCRYGYNDIVTIPAGATNIDIKQRSHRGVRHDGNYLALRTLEGRYLLIFFSAMEQDILIKGTILKYSGSMTTLERLQSFQQLPEPLTVQLLTIASEVFPPKVKYTFFIPKDVPFSKEKGKEKKSANVIRPMLTSQWVLGDWSECSKTCGSGWQRRTVDCRDVEGQASSTCDRALKPEDIKACGDFPCPLWRRGARSHRPAPAPFLSPPWRLAGRLALRRWTKAPSCRRRTSRLVR